MTRSTPLWLGPSALLAAFAVTTSCLSGGSIPSGIVDSAGVTISNLGQVDSAASFTVEQLAQIAADDSSSPAHLLPFVSYASADSAGRLYVYDAVTQRVVVADLDGKVIGARGRTGGGPGEYLGFDVVEAAWDGELSVVDYGKMAVIRFDSAGGVLPERSFARLGYPLGGIRFVDAAAVFTTWEAKDKAAEYRVVQAAPASADTLAHVRVKTLGSATFDCGDSRITLSAVPRLFSPVPQWESWQGLVAVTEQAVYRVDLFEVGRLRRSFRRPLLGRRSRSDDVRLAYPAGRAVGTRHCQVDAPRLTKGLGVAERLPTLGSIRFSPNGVLWIQRYEIPAAPTAVDLVSVDGKYLGTVKAPVFPISFIGGGRMVGVGVDEETAGFRLILMKTNPPQW